MDDPRCSCLAGCGAAFTALPSDRVAGFGEGDVQQATERLQSVRGSHLAQFIEPADDEAKRFRAGFYFFLVRHFSGQACISSR
ncbi:hypothetical protein [Mesorhizobium abyssinicae]|uniref:hypothetical protein n=1 Tax=Mesorhizobium abyssinicae TaxID=1209958 RepID=UPI0033911E84